MLALYPLLPNKTDVWRGPDRQIYYTYWCNTDESRPDGKSGGVTLSKNDVLHIPGLSFDRLVGYSPIALAKNAGLEAVRCANGKNRRIKWKQSAGSPEKDSRFFIRRRCGWRSSEG